MTPDARSPIPDELTSEWSVREILTQAQALSQTGAWALIIPTGQVWWSDESYRIFGREPEDTTLTYASFLDCVHPDDRDEVAGQVAAAIAGSGRYELRHRLVRPDGDVRYVHAQGHVTRGEDGEPLRILGVGRDITDEVETQAERDAAIEALRASEERYRLLAENAWDVIWTMGVDGSITYVSPSVERVRGITPAEAMAQTLDQIHPPESAALVSEYFTSLYAAMAVGEVPPIYRGEREYFRKDGSIMLGELQVIPQVDADGAVVQILGVTRDISERRRLEEELERLAVTDPLTGIWNRRQGEKLIHADLADRRRYRPSLALLMVDVDHFKAINDTYGHQAGDRVLIETTQLITANLRTTDVLARWGGDEFVVLMRHCSLADAVPLAETLRAVIAAHHFEEVGTVTVSIGAAPIEPDDDIRSFLRRADEALYRAKHSGRNNVKAPA